jgi:hypothetical protein
MVDSCRESGTAAAGDRKLGAERPQLVGFAKCRTPRSGTKPSFAHSAAKVGYRQGLIFRRWPALYNRLNKPKAISDPLLRASKARQLRLAYGCRITFTPSAVVGKTPTSANKHAASSRCRPRGTRLDRFVRPLECAPHHTKEHPCEKTPRHQSTAGVRCISMLQTRIECSVSTYLDQLGAAQLARKVPSRSLGLRPSLEQHAVTRHALVYQC